MGIHKSLFIIQHFRLWDLQDQVDIFSGRNISILQTQENLCISGLPTTAKGFSFECLLKWPYIVFDKEALACLRQYIQG